MRYPTLTFAALLLGALITTRAQNPAPEQLLPSDTIGIATIPDFPRLSRFYDESPLGRLWTDPSMKPFTDKFVAQFRKELLEPLQKELGINFSEYKDLLQGQVTFALTPPTEGTDSFFGLLFLMDARDKSEALATRLDDLRKKWTESGKELRAEKIRDVEFTRISFTQGDIQGLLKEAFPSSEEEEPDEDEPVIQDEKTELYIGQSKSLFIAGENPKAIEKVLARQGGGELAPLAELGGFQSSHNLLFRDSLGYAWLNFKPIYQHILKLAAAEQEAPPPGMPKLQVEKVLPALGLASLNHLGVSLSGSAAGTSVDAFISVPEAQREGLFRIFALENKSSAPPAFIPADVLKFQRIRMDARKAWAGLEEMLGKIDPGMVGMLQLMLSAVEAAGQQQDPDFSFKENFIANLGDDFISYQKPPRTSNPEDIVEPPSLILLGSARPVQLAEAMRFVMMLAPIAGPPEEREFLGKKVYSITTALPAGDGEDSDDEAPPVSSRTISFAASGEYVAISTDTATLEEYLRASGSPAKSLRQADGLAEAAQKVGGMETGLFSYENQRDSYRIVWDAIRKDPEALNSMFFPFPSGQDGEGLAAWLDFTLLPEFDRVAKYFGIAVMSAATTPEGYVIHAYGPTPAEAR